MHIIEPPNPKPNQIKHMNTFKFLHTKFKRKLGWLGFYLTFLAWLARFFSSFLLLKPPADLVIGKCKLAAFLALSPVTNWHEIRLPQSSKTRFGSRLGSPPLQPALLGIWAPKFFSNFLLAFQLKSDHHKPSHTLGFAKFSCLSLPLKSGFGEGNFGQSLASFSNFCE
jgi:hypothetical protein